MYNLSMQVIHDTTEYKIPIMIEYSCLMCMDRKFIVVETMDGFEDERCPKCNPKLTVSEQMDDDS